VKNKHYVINSDTRVFLAAKVIRQTVIYYVKVTELENKVTDGRIDCWY